MNAILGAILGALITFAAMTYRTYQLERDLQYQTDLAQSWHAIANVCTTGIEVCQLVCESNPKRMWSEMR